MLYLPLLMLLISLPAFIAYAADFDCHYAFITLTLFSPFLLHAAII